jgi:hypothetical protein
MYLFAIGALLALIGISVGVFLGSSFSERNAKNQKPNPKPDAAEAASKTGTTERRRFWFSSGNSAEFAQQFQTWAGSNLQDEELRNWVNSLSKEQVRALTEQLAGFCRSLGFELNWLTEQRLNGTPGLERSAREIVERYCAACWQATVVQGDLQQFKKLLDLVEQPFSREHKAITLKLYAELVRREVVPTMAPELAVAPEQERQEHIARSLKDIAGKNWSVLMEAYNVATQGPEASRAEAEKEPWTEGIRRAVRPRRGRATPEEKLSDEIPVQSATPSESAS